MSDLTLTPFANPIAADVTPPGSKSLTNRALVLAALAEGPSTLANVLFADDTLVMIDCLRRLGFNVQVDRDALTARVVGAGGRIPADSAELFCGNSGTTIRFLAALCTLGRGTFTLDGIPRMRQRPLGDLVAMLRNLGGRVEYAMADGFPPLRILGRRTSGTEGGSLPGGRVRFGRSQSSQFLSAVLQVSPYARHEVLVDLEPKQTSWPYVAMTMRLMDEFGLTPELIRDPLTAEPQRIIIPQGHYRPTDYAIEPDASNASYFLAAAAVNPGSKVTVRGLGKRSLQGDVGFADVLHRMGAGLIFGQEFITIAGPDKLAGIDVDLATMPDTAQTLAVTALFAGNPTTLRGLHTLRVKETDRVAALATELAKLGAGIELDGDDLTITPPRAGRLTPAAIDTYDDHRMAMSFAIAGTRFSGVTIRDPGCVNKTYPNYFADLERLRA